MPSPSGPIHPPTGSRATVPPSEPRSSRASFDALDAHVDRPARIQMIVALILGLVLVAIPLYLWRRPRAESISATTGAADAGGVALPAVTAGATSPSSDAQLVLGEPKVVSCHDPGAKKTAPEKCDHVVEFERAFGKAIEESASCVPKDAGGGSLIWVTDVTFKKKTMLVMSAKEGSTFKNKKVTAGCEKAIRAKLPSMPWETAKHEHARYFISITATYPGAPK